MNWQFWAVVAIVAAWAGVVWLWLYASAPPHGEHAATENPAGRPEQRRAGPWGSMIREEELALAELPTEWDPASLAALHDIPEPPSPAPPLVPYDHARDVPCPVCGTVAGHACGPGVLVHGDRVKTWRRDVIAPNVGDLCQAADDDARQFIEAVTIDLVAFRAELGIAA